MPTGDSLSVFLGLLFFAAGSAVTAYTQTGAKARNLYILGVLFALLAIAWMIVPTDFFGSPEQIVKRMILATPLIAAVLVLSALRTRQPSTGPARAPPEEQAKRDRRQLSTAIQIVLQNARNRMVQDNSARSAEIALNDVKALFLSLNKEKGIPFYPQTNRPIVDLEAALRILEAIKPLLALGHDEEATQAATAMVGRWAAASSG